MADFSYESIPAGYYDKIYRKTSGIQSKWHHLKFQHVYGMLRPCGRLLDVGCGPGTFVGNIPMEMTCYGVDISKNQIEYANEHYGQVATYSCNYPKCNLPDDKFDYITLLEVIEHIKLDSLQSLLVDIKKYIKPTGRMILTTPNYASLYPILEAVVNKISPVSYEDQHISKFNKNILYSLLSDLGFYNIKIHSFLNISPFLAGISWKLSSNVFTLEEHLPFGFLLCASAGVYNEE